MIQIYSPDNTNYSKNGDMVLSPTSCYAESRLKGEWKLTLSHPLDEEGRWKYIVENAVISVPTSLGKGQLYRINYVERTDTGVDAEAIPVFFDAANEIFLMDLTLTNKNGQEALNAMLNGRTDKYSVSSDISERTTSYFVRKNFIEALNNADDEMSFVNRWGGEPIYYNYQLIMNESAGRDRGVYILYGKNVESISETVDISELVTRIIPVSSDGYTLEGPTPWVDSELIGNYPIVFTKECKYDGIRLREDAKEEEEGGEEDPSAEDGEYSDLPSLRAALYAMAESEYRHGKDLDKPKVNLKINMIDLTRTDMYKEYSALETVHLGDTVHCKHSVLGIVTDAKVIYIRWDCVRNCIDTIEVGEANYDYFSTVNSAMNSIPVVPEVFDEHGSIIASYIHGIIDLAKTRLEYQKDNAKRSDIRAILYEDTMETFADGTPNPQYGALCIGTAGIQISHEKDIYGEWIWGTAIDFQSIQADHIITGTLSDKNGTNYWNLDTGEFRLSTSAELLDGTSLVDYVTAKSEASAQNAMSELDRNFTQTVIFNRLTNGGISKGIFMEDGQLYINMDYLATGTIKVGGENNSEGQIEFYDEAGGKYGWINNTRAVFYNMSAASSNFNTINVGGPDLNSEIDYAAIIEGVQIGQKRGGTHDTYAHIGVSSNLDGLRIGGNLQIIDWSGSFRKPVTSYATDGNRIAYLASHSDDHTVPNSVGINGQFGSTTTYTTKNFAPSSSDVRLKENIKDCDISALPFVESIRMRQFDWKSNGVHQDCGFVADELEKLDPNLSIGGGYDEDGSMNEKSVNDFYLLGYLTKAVQELSAKVKDLESKLKKFPG